MSEIWPKFFYHESCREGKKFFTDSDVPKGWVTGPHLISTSDEPEDEMDSADADAPRRSPGRPRKIKE